MMLPTKFRFIWPSGSEEKIKKIRPIRNKNCLWWPCLLMDRNEMSNLYKGPSIDVSYQVSVHLAKVQRRRLKCKKLTDDRWRTSSDGKISHCLWQGEIKMVPVMIKNLKILRNSLQQLSETNKNLRIYPCRENHTSTDKLIITGLVVIKLWSTNFVLKLRNLPIKTLHKLNTVFLSVIFQVQIQISYTRVLWPSGKM